MSQLKEIKTWLAHRRRTEDFLVRKIDLAASKNWRLQNGAMRHASGKFFQIVGLRWRTTTKILEQPFIRQREIGTLGFFMRVRKRQNELLVQAKAEPGNVGLVQL